MKNKLALVLLLFVTSGCHRSLDRIMGDGNPSLVKEKEAPFYTVSCCQDSNAGTVSYPSFVPDSHVKFCNRVTIANQQDGKIDGNIYLAMHVDCGHGRHDIGDQYYPPKGY